MRRLVTIGDSLTQGFQHLAIRRADWSYPAMVARALGADDFRFGDFSTKGDGGPFLDLELVCQDFAGVGTEIELVNDAVHILRGLHRLRGRMDRIEDYWERGPGTGPAGNVPIHDNLAVWGFELLDALTLSDGVCLRNTPPADDQLVMQGVESAMYRTARRVLNPRQDPALEELTQIELAAKLSESEPIEDLIFALGANNALATCLRLQLAWSQSADFRKLPHQRQVTIWEPDHFRKIYDRAASGLGRIKAKRVYLATVPHVTIAPVARGNSPRARKLGLDEVVTFPDSPRGYYEYYTRFWLWDDAFDPLRDEHIKREDAHAVDRAIDEYNDHIKALAKKNRWHVIDLCKVLDDLAFRSTQGQPTYAFPAGLVRALEKHPDTRFRVRKTGKTKQVLLDARYMRIPLAPPADSAPFEEWQKAYCGGLFGLDGVHPTTIGYGIMAHEVLKAMKAAGSPGADPDTLDWDGIVANDTFVCQPPAVLATLQQTLAYLFARLGLGRLIPRIAGMGSEP